jgi:hypothetical protein
MSTPKPPAPILIEVRLPLPPQTPETDRALKDVEAQIFRAGVAYGRAEAAAETNAQLAREVARLKQARKP